MAPAQKSYSGTIKQDAAAKNKWFAAFKGCKPLVLKYKNSIDAAVMLQKHRQQMW
jgi:hypothetical protein